MVSDCVLVGVLCVGLVSGGDVVEERLCVWGLCVWGEGGRFVVGSVL